MIAPEGASSFEYEGPLCKLGIEINFVLTSGLPMNE